MLSFVFSIYARYSLETTEFCSVDAETDRRKKAGKTFFHRLWRYRFSPVKWNSDLQTEISSKPWDLLNKAIVSLTKSFGHSTVFWIIIFFFDLFIKQLHSWECVSKLSMRLVFHFLVPWKFVLFIDFFFRYLTIFFSVPLYLDGLMWYTANDLYVPWQTEFKWQDLLDLTKSPWNSAFTYIKTGSFSTNSLWKWKIHSLKWQLILTLSFSSNYFVNSHIFSTRMLQDFELAKHKKLEKSLKKAGHCEIRTQIGSICQDT